MIDLEEMRKENKRLEKLLEKVENGFDNGDILPFSTVRRVYGKYTGKIIKIDKMILILLMNSPKVIGQLYLIMKIF